MIDDEYILEIKNDDSFSLTYKAIKKGNETKYTIIRIMKNLDDETIEKILEQGREIMKELNHPNIPKVIDYKEDSKSHNYICEYYSDQNIRNYFKDYMIEKNKPLSEDIVQFIMKQVVSAIKYLHDKKIVHRDIKSENLFIKYNSEEDLLKKNIFNSKIILEGFYISTHLKKGDKLDIRAGTANNMAPEIINSEYNEKVDIWGLGVICFELLHGGLPYTSKRFNNRNKFELKKPLSKEAISFIDCMLEVDQNKRASAFELSKHAFLTKNIRY